MADDILNINGKLIRLRDNGDGTWSWATALTGSLVSPSDYTTTDSKAVAFTLDNLPATGLVVISNTGANPASLWSDLYYDGVNPTKVNYPFSEALLPAGTNVLIPVNFFGKLVLYAQSRNTGSPTTLRCRVRTVSAPELMFLPWEMRWTTAEVAADATLVERGVALQGLGAKKVGVSVTCSVAHTFTAYLQWADVGSAGGFFQKETIPDSATANQGKHGLFDVKASHARVSITNSDTVSHTYIIIVWLIP